MNISIYNYTDYKIWINEWVDAQPKNGFGEYRRIAQALNVSTTMISQIFKSEKQMSLELATELCDYLKLDEEESDYLLLLVDYARAGSHKLQKRFERQIKQKREKAKKLENRVKATELSEHDKTVFYSTWMYSGVRQLASIENYSDIDLISKRLSIPRMQVQKIIDFLLSKNLLVLNKNKLASGTTRTHLGSSSALVSRHHQNWRLQGFQKMIHADDNQFFYTSPMSMSHEVADWIRQELPSIVEKVTAKVLPSKSETVRCLNIDWFEY